MLSDSFWWLCHGDFRVCDVFRIGGVYVGSPGTRYRRSTMLIGLLSPHLVGISKVMCNTVGIVLGEVSTLCWGTIVAVQSGGPGRTAKSLSR